MRALRGATQLKADDPAEMTEAVVELVRAILTRNGLTTDDLISVIFTSTPDLRSAFPAAAARTLGIGDVPLLCAQELDVDGALPRVVRVLGARGAGRPQARGRPRVPQGCRGAAPGSRPVTPSLQIVGAGLLGTSVGLALARSEWQVWVADCRCRRRAAGG